MTIKGDVCRKWGSNPNWREGYDRIFGKRNDEVEPDMDIEDNNEQTNEEEICK